MFNLYKKQALYLVVLLLFAACKKDLGNYNYTELNDVNFGGIGKTYTVLLGEKLQITPEFKFSKENNSDENAFSYQWYAFDVNANLQLPADQRKNIATTRNLDAAIQIPPGNYLLYYSVTDKKTGVVYTTKIPLKVETTIYEGWMVLNDVNGAARLDMVSKIKNVYTPIVDVLAQAGSELVLKGKPLNVTCYPFSFSTYGVSVSTDQSSNRVDPETFRWKNTFNLSYEMVASVPAGFHADFLAPVKEDRGICYMYSGGNVYFNYSLFSINYGVPINLVTGEKVAFKAAPFIAATMNLSNFSPTAVLFDSEKKRFLRHSGSERSVSTIPAPQAALFNTSNMGMDMLHMEYTPYNGGEIFAVMKNTEGKSYLVRFSPFNGAHNYFAEITGTDIALAEKFALSPVFGYLFYCVGGKVYEYDTSLKTTKLMIDKGTERISLMKFQDFARSSNTYYKDKANQLMVCSYLPTGPADKNGKMEFYDVPSLNGNLTLTEGYSGFGKIVSVSYRQR
uniref:PKD-like family lipoprotein n=1 Tax=Pedobacter schmidteae TaxID=2201271 RepID=UPI000EB1E192|nr:PKD-like family lipoprotein [Pedobacter schmidteae]